MHVELVRTVTSDGLRLDGCLALPATLPSGRAVDAPPPPRAALFLHGVGGNFYTFTTLEPLAQRLRQAGWAVLMVNTRGHDLVYAASVGNARRRLGAAYETVADCCRDVAAWVDWLQQRHIQQVALVGHSLGAIKALYSQAHQPHSAVACVVAISPPRLSYAAFRNAPESSLFEESLATARQLVEAGRPEELFTCRFPFPLLITAGGYLDKYGPGERYNLLRFVTEVPCPVLIVYGGKELAEGGIPFAGMPEALASLPGGERRQVRILAGADHVYTGCTEPLAEVVAAWLHENLNDRGGASVRDMGQFKAPERPAAG